MDSNNKSLNRFSDRVENYIKYRPTYPAALFQFLTENNIVGAGNVIADIGSGTGISTLPFLEKGFEVSGVEPNDEMRLAAERILSKYPTFNSVKATAESTGLNSNTFDLIVAGQAFHWFDVDKARLEFIRILKPEGKVLLMWNDRRTEGEDFLRLYEDFLQMFGTDYAAVNHKNVQDKKVFQHFFGNEQYKEKWFDNFQEVDFTGLKGRVLSSSYMPNEGHPDYEHMIYCLKKIFMRYQVNGKVRLEYDTKIYWGTLSE